MAEIEYYIGETGPFYMDDTSPEFAMPTQVALKQDISGAAGDTVVTEKAFGQSESAGTSELLSRVDHTHGTPAAPSELSGSTTVVSETYWGITPAAGTSPTFSRGDHTHGSPDTPIDTFSTTVSDETSFGISPSAGTSTHPACGDHTHGTPANPVSGVTADKTVGAETWHFTNGLLTSIT